MEIPYIPVTTNQGGFDAQLRLGDPEDTQRHCEGQRPGSLFHLSSDQLGPLVLNAIYRV